VTVAVGDDVFVLVGVFVKVTVWVAVAVTVPEIVGIGW